MASSAQPISQRESALKRYSATTLQDIWKEADQLPRATEAHLFVQHFRRCLHSIRAEPFQFALNVVTTALLVFLFSSLLWFFELAHGIGRIQTELTTLTLFLHDEALPDEITELKEALSSEPSVDSVEYVSREEALREFRESLGGSSSVLDGLEEQNPLPSSLRVALGASESARESLAGLVERFRIHPAVLQVQYPEELLEKVFQLFSTFRSIALGIALGIAILVGYLVAATIRLTIFARKREIQIMDLVGATPEYIRAPFLVESSFIALGGITFGLLLLATATSALVPLIPSELATVVGLGEVRSQLSFFSVIIVVFVVFLSATVGSWLSVRNFQRSER